MPRFLSTGKPSTFSRFRSVQPGLVAPPDPAVPKRHRTLSHRAGQFLSELGQFVDL